MKKVLFTIILAVQLFFIAKSQVINVCGTDTIKYQLENYQNGIINWQESYDTITWKTIPNATGTTYSFYPTEEKYYRAMIKTSVCDPLYSPISFVQLPPQANAGSDRVISSNTTTLFGSNTTNAIGEWSIIYGSGTIYEPQNPRSEFAFSSDTSVLLLWTVTNSCGQSSDMVNLIYDELETNNNFIVVDITDEILSDSTEMANGIYKIKFSDPEITPGDSVILIGMRDDISFLQVVTSFTYQDSVYNFTTEQGTFEDLFTSGVFNMGDAVNQSMTQKDGSLVKGFESFPTRETFNKFSDNKGIKLLYVSTDYDDRYPELKGTDFYSPEKGFVINLPNIDLFQSGEFLKLSIENSFVSLDPNFVLDLHFNWRGKLKWLKIGVDNAQFQYGYNTTLDINNAVTYEYERSITELSRDIYFMIGPVPVMVRTNFNIVAGFSAEASGNITFDRSVLNTRYFTALVHGNPGDLHLYTHSSNSKEENFDIILDGELTSELKIGPQVSFMAYGIVGPYIDVPLKAEASLCAASDLENVYWQANAGLGIEGNLGARAEIWGHTLFDFCFNIFDCPLGPQIIFPYELELISGDNQNGYVDSLLTNPVIVKVKSSIGFPVPGVQLRVDLDSGNGSTSQTTYFSNTNGLVYIDWQLGSNPVNEMIITTADCNFDNLNGSPLYVHAKYDCENTDLQISMVRTGENISPVVSGGEEPYQYSLDGITYSSEIPVFSIYTPGEFSVFVKDVHECQVVNSFVIEPYDPCIYSELSVFIYVEENTVELNASEGTPPYLFALDYPPNYSGTDWYGYLSPGIHIAYVKDDIECIDSVIFEIPEDAVSPLVAIYPADNQYYIPVANVTFEWLAGNYAENQIYDLYLKLDGETYSQTAANHEDESFTYAGTLEFNSLYYWSVVVKDQAGITKDSAEFSFTTSNQDPTLPNPAVLVSPENGMMIDSASVNLEWVDQPGDFVYDVYIDDSDASYLTALNLSDSLYTVTNLQDETTYYWKIVTKSLETGLTAESDVFSFIIDTVSTITDIEGNVYQTVVIGGQKWMQENLKALRYNDGIPIEKIIDDTLWKNTITPAYCWYNNDSITYASTYGALYNWYTVDTLSNGNKNVCPFGWHVPNNDEWNELFNYLGGWVIAGSKMKQTGTVLWNPPNTDATNESGYTALPGGIRRVELPPGPGDVSFENEGHSFFCWSINYYNSDEAYCLEIMVNNSSAFLDYTPGRRINNGSSVRCIKD